MPIKTDFGNGVFTPWRIRLCQGGRSHIQGARQRALLAVNGEQIRLCHDIGRAIFYKRLLPLLEIGREREGIDLSKVVLQRHHLKYLGKQPMPLAAGKTPKLEPLTEAGGGSVHDKEKAYLAAIIEKVNELFGADTTDQDYPVLR
jgi:hypothetical protein